MNRFLSQIAWAAIAVVAALTLGGIALHRGEPINSMWLIVAAASSYLVGYRFYAKWIATRVMVLDNSRATPAEHLRNGQWAPGHEVTYKVDANARVVFR